MSMLISLSSYGCDFYMGQYEVIKKKEDLINSSSIELHHMLGGLIFTKRSDNSKYSGRAGQGKFFVALLYR